MKFIIVIVLLVLYVCHVMCDLSTKYNHHVTVDESNKFQLFWTIRDDMIQFAVEVETIGWIGLGISTGTGMMKQADVIMGWVKDGKGFIQDRFSDGYYLPSLDSQQDVHLTAFKEEGGKTTLEFNRKIVTCDERDHPINEGTVRVIWSYHTSDPENENSGFQKHAARGSKSIMLLNSFKGNSSLPSNTMSIDFTLEKASIPNDTTTYWCQMFKVPEFGSKKHIFMFEPVIQSGNEGIVHHMVVYICHDSFNASHENASGPCDHPNMPRDVRRCRIATLFAWAVGAGNFSFPDHVGFPLGEADSPNYFMLEIHYDNPKQKSDITDSSGIRFYMTSDVRKYDADMFLTGVSQSWVAMVIPPKQKEFLLTGHCIKKCTEQSIPEEGMHVLAIMPHTHLTGHSVRLRHVRDGVELPTIIADDNYDFNFQEYQYLNKEIIIKPGDELLTECRYNTMSRDDVTQGGEDTSEEMCYAFIIYYPKNPKLLSCVSTDLAVLQLSYNYFYNATTRKFKSDWTAVSPWKEEYTTNLNNSYQDVNAPIILGCLGKNGSAPGFTSYTDQYQKINITKKYSRDKVCQDTKLDPPKSGAIVVIPWITLLGACVIVLM